MYVMCANTGDIHPPNHPPRRTHLLHGLEQQKGLLPLVLQQQRLDDQLEGIDVNAGALLVADGHDHLLIGGGG